MIKFDDFLKYAEACEYPIYKAADLFSDHYGIHVDICQEKWKLNNGDDIVKYYNVHEFRVDDHCRGLYIYTYNGVQFAHMITYHEDKLNYHVTNNSVFDEFVNFVMRCTISNDEFPLIQSFESTYNIMGKNLLYVNDDGSFSLIEKYWQDKEKIKNDAINDVTYHDMYRYHKFEVMIDGKHNTVDYKRIVGVLCDNKELADRICNDMNINDSAFTYVYEYLGFKLRSMIQFI